MSAVATEHPQRDEAAGVASLLPCETALPATISTSISMPGTNITMTTWARYRPTRRKPSFMRVP